MAGNCTPDPDGCDMVCGDKVDSTANQTEYMSECYITGNGWTWVAVACPSGATCDPKAGGACGTKGLYNPECTQTCTLGATRCAPDGTGVQTCVAADGGSGWGASVACNAVQGLVCQTDPTSGNGVCGSPVCFAGTGTCVGNGLYDACVNYVLGPVGEATACPTGQTCEPTGATAPGAFQPGACTAVCTAGESMCADSTDIATSAHRRRLGRSDGVHRDRHLLPDQRLVDRQVDRSMRRLPAWNAPVLGDG